jgi:hypothetical protein
MSLVQCRYNPNHQMKSSRLLIHEDKCPDRNSKLLKMCPYNPLHKVAPFNLESHKRDCPQRPKVDENLEKELKEYLRAQSQLNHNNNSTKVTGNPNAKTVATNDNFTQRDSDSNSVARNIFNSQASKKIIGMSSKNEKRMIKTEKKKKQKEMMNLIDNSNFEESGILDNINISLKRNNFDENDYMNASEINTQNFEITESILNQINEFIENSREEYEQEDINAYDPNESELHIDRKNKNNIFNDLDLDRKDEDFSMIFSTSMSKNI